MSSTPPLLDDTTDPTVDTPSDGGRSWLPVVVLLVAAVSLVAWFASRPGETTASSDADGELAGAISEIEFELADGTTTTLADYRGQPTVVNFFAAWCPPCRAELPDFETVFQARRDEIAFVGISHDLVESDWLDLVDETGVTFDTGFQPNQELFVAIDGVGMPTTMFLDGDGTITHVHSGIVNTEILDDLITTHLGQE